VSENLLSTSIKEISPLFSAYSLENVFASDTFEAVTKSKPITLRGQSLLVTIKRFLQVELSSQLLLVDQLQAKSIPEVFSM
jgi:hypothetical protein